MNDVSRRDFFAANADISWMKDNYGEYLSIDFIAEKCGINRPPSPLNIRQVSNFITRAEIAWRWRYADLMLKGS